MYCITIVSNNIISSNCILQRNALVVLVYNFKVLLKANLHVKTIPGHLEANPYSIYYPWCIVLTSSKWWPLEFIMWKQCIAMSFRSYHTRHLMLMFWIMLPLKNIFTERRNYFRLWKLQWEQWRCGLCCQGTVVCRRSLLNSAMNFLE